MLRFENTTDAPVEREEVVEAALKLCQAELVRVASEMNLGLYPDSFEVFTSHIRTAIDDPNSDLTPAELVVHAQMFAMRGAQAMLRAGEARFHEGTWSGICPIWPFC